MSDKDKKEKMLKQQKSQRIRQQALRDMRLI